LDFPKSIHIDEEGPREGFQIERNIVPTDDKVRFIEALADTGLKQVQAVSFVNPKRVPNMADAEDVASKLTRRPGVEYTATWLNVRGLERALATPLDVQGKLLVCASESFEKSNTNKSRIDALNEQSRMLEVYREHKVPLKSAIVSTAFGCNIEGDIPIKVVLDSIASLLDVIAEQGLTLPYLRVADTVGWATPNAVARVVGSIRERWPDLRLGLHLHDTRGTGIANAWMGMSMGIADFDTACAGLGGCPFAGHKGAAGNICTEDLVFLCQEMGIETGVDLDALIECARMAEGIFGRELPGKVMHGGSLSAYRKAARV